MGIEDEYTDDQEPRPLINVGGNVDKTTAALRISGDDLDPEEVTRLLNCEPSFAHRKGEMRTISRSEKQRVALTGQWQLKSPLESVLLEDHIYWILDMLNTDQWVWDSMKDRHRMDIFCGLFLDAWNRGTILSPEVMAELGRRGIELSLDIYSAVPKEED